MWIEYGTAMADRLRGDAPEIRRYLRQEYGDASLAPIAVARATPRRKGPGRGVLAALMHILGIVGRRTRA